MPQRNSRHSWTDGDTYLFFGLLVLACGAGIIQHALVADNWVAMPDDAVSTHVAK